MVALAWEEVSRSLIVADGSSHIDRKKWLVNNNANK
jgi:hypothetical protein